MFFYALNAKVPVGKMWVITLKQKSAKNAAI